MNKKYKSSYQKKENKSLQKKKIKRVKTLIKKRSFKERVPENTEIKYPMRLSRAMYIQDISSRREADRLISQCKILVNGKVAELGQKILEKDKIEIVKEVKKKLFQKKIIVFNKPIGVVSHNPQLGEKEPNNFFPFSEKLSPIGRLDKASKGLLLMSNDGRLVNKLLNPNFSHQKEYVVKVDKHLNKNFYNQMEAGVNIEGYLTRPATINKVEPRVFSLVLTEGKKHQIRRMCASLGYKVLDLQRIRFLNIKLNELEEGNWRKLTTKEENYLKSVSKSEKK